MRKIMILLIGLAVLSIACERQIVGGDKDEHGCIPSAGYTWCEAKQKCIRQWEENCTQLVGGDKDEHGCIPSAGYSWCETKQKCLRTWEEPCSDNAELQSCTTDADCIPHPAACHPTECINRKFEGDFKKPEACTAIFMYEAAYSPEDCACLNNVCVNKNKGRTDDSTVTKPYDFEQCVADGNPVMESYPRKCSANGATYTEELPVPEERHVCTSEESANNACTLEYAPVCGEIVLNMGKTIYQTFGNGCAACAAMKTVAYTPGECLQESRDICYDGEGNSMTLAEAISIAKTSECGNNLKTECVCPSGYRKDGDSCNPDCYYSTPQCGAPSMECPQTVSCNSGTGTYWIDMTTEKEGCNPACVVNVKAKTAEINWRCTGAMSEPGSLGTQ
jgi:hypothetical protein